MNTEAEKRYFEETARTLRHEGFQVEQLQNGQLGVSLDDQLLCEVTKTGGITYRNENVATLERLTAKSKVYGIASTTAEYMRQMEAAPPLAVSDLKDRYKVLADFNGIVLAGAFSKHGVEFVTWEWGFNREGVSQGHYYNMNYAAAKQDFAIRSGLISGQRVFEDEQLIEIYRCCADTLDAGFDLTYEQEMRIKSVQEQIEGGMPDIMDRIKEQDQHSLETPSQELTM